MKVTFNIETKSYDITDVSVTQWSMLAAALHRDMLELAQASGTLASEVCQEYRDAYAEITTITL